MTPIMSMDAGIKFNASTDHRCRTCFESTYRRLVKKFELDNHQVQLFYDHFEKVLNESSALSSPEIQSLLSQKFNEIIGINDPYFEEKKISNQLALEFYKIWKVKVEEALDPFLLALKLSIAGNIMDYGANNDFDLKETISSVLNAKFAIDYSEKLRRKVYEAKTILYLGDNAGEIVFDRLFIETMLPKRITFAVKEGPILNDATLADALEVEMDKHAMLISNGSNAPSTILSTCSNEFLNIYKSADLIISKGQGNLEGLMNEKDERIFFLFMAKCEPIAELLNVEKFSFNVYNRF